MPEKEIVRELISDQEWRAILWLFLSGLAVTFFKKISSNKKITNLWQAFGAVILGGFITAGIGGFLIWLFPSMKFYVVMMITGALSTLLESRDIHDIILVRMGVNRDKKKEKNHEKAI